MRKFFGIALLAVLVATLFAPMAMAQSSTGKVTVSGVVYTKWLWGNMRRDIALQNFTDGPGDTYGDNGQGTEVYVYLDSRLSRAVQVHAAFASRFYSNLWTNFGGWGNPSGSNDCTGNPAGTVPNCGEASPLTSQYVKLRGATVTLTPGYSWMDTAVIGSNDFGMFDPFVVGRIRYIDRYNGSGILLQGSASGRSLTWDAARVSLPRYWAGPSYNTGSYMGADASYVGQLKYKADKWNVGGIFNWVNDIEIDNTDLNWDNGRSTRTRFRQSVFGVKAGFQPNEMIDIRAAYYYSDYESANDLAPANFFALSGFSPVPAGKHTDWTGKVNVDFNNIGDSGFSVKLEGFRIGGEYSSIMAARRESDVLLTEGHESFFALPGPDNSSFGVFAGNPSKIGYGGWNGNAQQLATINIDNNVTDFEEPLAETCIGWEGVTIVPMYTKGPLEALAEFSWIGRNTNWQAWGDATRPIDSALYPNMESDAGVGSYRSAYAPFANKETTIALGKVKYTFDVGKGLELQAKVKYIGETDERMNEARFLPYKAGDCATSGTLGCKNQVNNYYGNYSTAAIYGNPNVIEVNGVRGYQWKPFDSLSDDDRDLSMLHLGASLGYQLTNDLNGTIGYNYWDADLQDGNTAFQAYQLHKMASGKHIGNQLWLRGKYVLAGMEFGIEWQYNFGTFEPDFGGGFVPQIATQKIAEDAHVPVGSKGFSGRFGGWNSLEKVEFDHQRLKAFMKVQF